MCYLNTFGEFYFLTLHVLTGSQPPESKTRQNGSKPPPGTQRHQKKAMQT